jgi:hypothetical protein
MNFMKLIKRAIVVAIVLASILTIAAPAYAATIKVSTFEELKDALIYAAAGDVINIEDFEYDLIFSEDITIPAGVTVNLGIVDMRIYGTIFVRGAFNINEGGGRLFTNEGSSIVVDGSFTNNYIMYNGESRIINNGTFTNNGEFLSDATIINSSVFINTGDLYIAGFTKNDGIIDDTGRIFNTSAIENNGTINSRSFSNSVPGVIDNYGVLHSVWGFANITGIINNYGSLIIDGEFYNVDGIVTNFGGSIEKSEWWAGNPVVEAGGFIQAEVSAKVTKLNGNQNLLKIIVIEYFKNSAPKTISSEIMINNNSAGIYEVGGYKVYVDTKGNTDIRACYFVK